VEKSRILLLAANPTDTPPLRLDEEIREIHRSIRAAEFRDSFELLSRWAVRPVDLLQAFNEVRPHIVHFSGHGSRKGELVFEDDDGTAKSVSDAALLSLFRNVKDNIRLVMLNSCRSEAQAQAISQEIEFCVGMNVAIGDEAAVIFASTIYGALAFGRSVAQAFEQGRTALMLQGIAEDKTPVLLTRAGADALTATFVSRRPLNPILPPIALEILESAVADNGPVILIPYDGGIGVQAGTRKFDSGFDLEQAALLDHAMTMLVQAGLLKQIDHELFHVTHTGYAAARHPGGQATPRFLQIKEQMPDLIAEMKKDLSEDNGAFVREFFVMSKRHILGGSEKPRFIYYLEDHENLRGKMDVLENNGYLIDVTPGNTPVYRMTEEFVGLVLAHG
jgi:hypothetical protein